jgi:hypothetical protein
MVASIEELDGLVRNFYEARGEQVCYPDDASASNATSLTVLILEP